MHRPAIPEDKVPWFHVHFEHLASSVFKPLEVFGVEEE